MNLKILRTEKGYSQQQLATKLNVSRSTVAMWEAGSSEPSMQMIRQIADILGVSISTIFGETADFPSPKTKKTVPVLGQIPAGIPIEAIEDILDYEDLSDREANDGYDYFGLRVTGNSMYPEYIGGDTIIVRRQETAETGDDAVVMMTMHSAKGLEFSNVFLVGFVHYLCHISLKHLFTHSRLPFDAQIDLCGCATLFFHLDYSLCLGYLVFSFCLGICISVLTQKFYALRKFGVQLVYLLYKVIHYSLLSVRLKFSI